MNDKWIAEVLLATQEIAPNALAEGIARFLGGRAAANNALRRADDPSLVKSACARIDKEIAQILPPDVAKTYSVELTKQRKFANDAAAYVLVDLLADITYLSETQAEELHPLISQWLEGKSLYLPFYQQNDQYVPDIPTSILSRVLTKKQVTMLDGLNRYNYDAYTYESQILQHEPLIVIKK